MSLTFTTLWEINLEKFTFERLSNTECVLMTLVWALGKKISLKVSSLMHSHQVHFKWHQRTQPWHKDTAGEGSFSCCTSQSFCQSTLCDLFWSERLKESIEKRYESLFVCFLALIWPTLLPSGLIITHRVTRFKKLRNLQETEGREVLCKT